MTNRRIPDPSTLRPIPSMEGYSITPYGDIYSHKRHRWLPENKHPVYGTHQRNFSPYGTKLIHHLVLITFKGPRPPGLIGLHIDDNKDNNHISNLEWGTSMQNSAQAILNKKIAQGSNCYNARFSDQDVRDIRRRRKQGETINSLAFHYKVWRTKIADIVHRRSYKNVLDESDL